jgi:molybdate transport system substrate-binding protein
LNTGKQLIIYSTFVPALPLKEAAIVFGSETGTEVSVNPGRPEQWIPRLKAGEPADLISYGAEFLLDIAEVEGLIVPGARRSVGRRRSGLIVPPGNPGSIAGLDDLAQPETRVGIGVEGCTLGLWDEISGRAGLTEKIRPNISVRAKGCGALLGAVTRGEVEAGFGWINMDQIPDMSVEIVRLPGELEIIRSTGVGIVGSATEPELAGDFVHWITTDPIARAIYKKWGWEIEN